MPVAIGGSQRRWSWCQQWVCACGVRGAVGTSGDDPTEGWLQCPKGMAQGRAGDCSGWDHELPSPILR